ncbi:methionyl-tRNA formyltransferase [Heterostelium album PN500]|uniref:methionyl-tRNA formyltransferase n=1 Tax=Heterostelium pallidum (strain ATCC 26659 / Pp 5 / PN500) TaxID=670386 RepID=D3B0K7_HETP5|nr:methionyl-tRNA formyltransferase [Heterostelium album PN500]EFA84831.1 methionyl-tRNA formyltransferase [Heterostelium album PN500]|eukprot:XP_020436942.1 methionyl-tRNA formyltransferase [Heterostelium album PN500]
MLRQLVVKNSYSNILNSGAIKAILNYTTFNSVNHAYRFRAYCSIAPPPYKVLFFGTDQVSINTLTLLHENNKIKNNNNNNNADTSISTNNSNNKLVVDELEVVCPDNKNELVYQYAKSNNIPMYHPDKENGMKGFKVPLSSKSNQPFDIAIVVSFGYFIPKSVLSSFKYGGINMHPSLLPRHRGPAPIHHTLLSGDKETGISIITLDPKKFDVGDILLQTRQKIRPDILYLELTNKLTTNGAAMVIKTLEQFVEMSKNAVAQSEVGATKAPKVNRQQSKIEWSQHDCATIWNMYRAFSDTIGVSTTVYSKKYKNWKRLKITGMLAPPGAGVDPVANSKLYSSLNEDLKQLSGAEPYGTYFLGTNKLMWIKAKDGWIGVSKIYEDGKKNDVQAHEFLFGKAVVSPTKSNNSIAEKIEIPTTQVFV